ncbi:hypothetical protein VTJ49DRAFT_1275 [Mycothermus thermophilus]|uniref:BTB domain-containing protein n=1 Tax=Humicola insolens TaxID=85995 RepID=A0ABR3VDF8_HUMIN
MSDVADETTTNTYDGFSHMAMVLTPPSSHDDMGALKIVDPDGDLILRSERSGSIKVCSAALRRASPVFKAMLFGPWKEAKPATGTWVVHIDDSEWPNALDIILPVIHGVPFDPPAVNAQQLSEVLIFADLYDMRQLLRPWITQCLVQHCKRGVEWKIPIYNQLRLLPLLRVAWEHGLADRFSTLLKGAILFGYKKDLEGLRDAGTICPENPHLLEKPAQIREALVTEYLEFYYKECETPCLAFDPPKSLAEMAERRTCHDGKLAVIGESLYPDGPVPKSAKDYTSRICNLDIQMAEVFQSELQVRKGHEACHPTPRFDVFKEALQRKIDCYKVLQPADETLLAERREKWGL